MPSLDQHSPWIFRHDEVDLLEEDIDDLYDLHQSTNGRIQTMEQAIIAEQLDTEERADAELAMQMDVKWLMNPEAEKTPWEMRTDRSNEPDDLSCDATRPPFYEQLFSYANQVFAHVSDVYARQDEQKEHAFRIQINCKMIPIKCAIAFAEASHEDPLSIALAKKELTLSIVYFERVLISLAYLASVGDEKAQSFLGSGVQMKNVLQQNLSRLLNNRRGFTPGYE